MSVCLSRMPARAVALVKPELQAQARTVRCHEPHGHRNRHEATIQVRNGDKLVPVQLRWSK